MGAVKRVFKSIGKVFGIGSRESSSDVQTIDTTPIQTAVQNQDVSLANDTIKNTKRRVVKEGARGLETAEAPAADTVVGGASSNDKRPVVGA